MTTVGRIWKILSGIIFLGIIFILEIDVHSSIHLMTWVISLMLLIWGLRLLWFYFTMARCMVGGKQILIRGVIVTDLGIFSITMLEATKFYIIMYFMAFYAFSGVVRILRGLEAKGVGAKNWYINVIIGVILVSIVLLSIFFAKTEAVLVDIFCLGLLFSAISSFMTAFRRTTVVYIQ